MSWDSYIDNLVAYCRDATGQTHCDKACIIGLDGGAGWTTHAHANALKLTPQEGSTIASCLKSKNFSSFQTNGLNAEGKRYTFLRDDDGKVVYAKLKGTGGLTIQATKTAIVLAHCPEGKQQGNVNKGVGTICDYLESMNM